MGFLGFRGFLLVLIFGIIFVAVGDGTARVIGSVFVALCLASLLRRRRASE